MRFSWALPVAGTSAAAYSIYAAKHAPKPPEMRSATGSASRADAYQRAQERFVRGGGPFARDSTFLTAWWCRTGSTISAATFSWELMIATVDPINRMLLGFESRQPAMRFTLREPSTVFSPSS